MTDMPTRHRLALGLCLLALLATGCERQADPDAATAVQPDTPASGEAPGQALPWQLDEGDLQEGVIEVVRGTCAEAPYAADVRWTLHPGHGTSPQIWIESPDSAPKLWISPSVREGEARTGAWLSDGSRLYLIDGNARRAISRVEVGAQGCTPAA